MVSRVVFRMSRGRGPGQCQETIARWRRGLGGLIARTLGRVVAILRDALRKVDLGDLTKDHDHVCY